MMPDEFCEEFKSGVFSFRGIWTSFDEGSPAGESKILTRVHRLLVNDDDADHLDEGATILRVATRVTYLIKTSTRSGAGVTELDLQKKPEEPYQGEF